MSKRILSLVLTLALVLGSFSMAFADTNAVPPTSSLALKDVEGTQYEKAVTTLGKLDILNGFPDGTFRPENTITRAEFAAVAVRVRGLETAAENSKGNTRFPDVDASHWASGYVNVAEKNGLVKGVVTAEGENIFRPEGKITYEQAVTMIVRALGYQYAAEALGGYPVGHLSVASREQLLRNIPVSEGSQGQPASRGFVALLVSNALDIPKMIQVGYGDQAKWIISGTEGTRETYLFEDLGLKQLTKAQVTKADSKTQKVTIGGTALKSDKDFDYAGFEGMRVTAWFNPRTDQLVVAKDDGAYKARYDVVKKVEGKNQLELVSSKDKINVSEKRTLKLNGESAVLNDFTEGSNAYAKVIVNEYGEINWVDAYSLEGKIVVKNVEKDTIKGYGREEISNANDYTIIKNGKQISASQLKDKDLVIYNAAEETAVVVTDVREGKLEAVYRDGFKFDGKTYDNKDVQYIVGDNLEEVNSTVLEEMKDNGNIKIYFSFDNKPLFIDGEAEEIANNYVMLASDSESFNDRGTAKHTFDVLNSKGEVVKYDIKDIDIENDKNIFKGSTTNWENTFKKNKVVKITTNSRNEITKIEQLGAPITIGTNGVNALEIDDVYLDGARVQANATVFMRDGQSSVKDYKVVRWADAEKEFKKVISGNAYVDNGRIVAIDAIQTDGDEQVETVIGVLKRANETVSKNEYALVVEVNGRTMNYYAKDFANTDNILDPSKSAKDLINVDKNTVVELNVTKDGKEVKAWSLPSSEKTVTVKTATASRIVDTDNVEYVVEGKYYNNSLDNIINSSVIEKGEDVTLYFQPGAVKKYVQVVKRGAGTIEPPTGDSEKVTYINDAGFVTAPATEDSTAVKITLPADNTTIYKVTVDGVDTITGINGTREITALELGLTDATEIDKADKRVIVRVYKEGVTAPISEKAIYTKDMAAATLSSAVAVEAAPAVPAVKAKLNLVANADIEVNQAGVAGNDYEIKFVVDPLLPTNTAKVVVSGKVVLITYDGTVNADDLNAIPEFSALFTAVGTDIATTAIATTQTGSPVGGSDAVAAKTPVLTLTFDKEMTAASTVTMTVNSKEVTGNVEWTTNKVAKVTFAADAANLAEITNGKTITEIDLVTKNGKAFSTISVNITN